MNGRKWGSKKRGEAANSFGSGLNFVNAHFIAFVTNCS
jgi:hypothetical protein